MPFAKKSLLLPAIASLTLAIAFAFSLLSRPTTDRRFPSADPARRDTLLPSRSPSALSPFPPPSTPGTPIPAHSDPALTSPSTFSIPASVRAALTTALRDFTTTANLTPAAREDFFSRILPPLIERLATEYPAATASDFAATPELAARLAAQLRAVRDFPAAYQEALQLADPAQRSSILACVLYQSEHRAPQSTLELAQVAPLGENRETVLQTLAAQWAGTDLAAATAWAMAQPATPSRDGIFQRLATACAATDPAQAAHLLAFGISPGPLQEETVTQIVARWPATRLAEASRWVQQLPTAPLRRFGEESLRSLGTTPTL